MLSFGGFLGIGDDHYPLPWQSLKYDTNLGGYRTGVRMKVRLARAHSLPRTVTVLMCGTRMVTSCISWHAEITPRFSGCVVAMKGDVARVW